MLTQLIFNSSSVWQKLRINAEMLNIHPKGQAERLQTAHLPALAEVVFATWEKSMCPKPSIRDCINCRLSRSGTYHLVQALLPRSLTQAFFLEVCYWNAFETICSLQTDVFFLCVTSLRLLIWAGRTNTPQSHLQNDAKASAERSRRLRGSATFTVTCSLYPSLPARNRSPGAALHNRHSACLDGRGEARRDHVAQEGVEQHCFKENNQSE